jgi:hypothetical protein
VVIILQKLLVLRILFKISQEFVLWIPIELFEFYDVYLSVTEKANQQSFELFANWAKTLLQDFNEIDRYLLDSSYVLSYLKDIEDIKKWGIEVENKTQLLENYIDFWKLLPNYYQTLYGHLPNWLSRINL